MCSWHDDLTIWDQTTAFPRHQSIMQQKLDRHLIASCWSNMGARNVSSDSLVKAVLGVAPNLS